VKVAAKAAALVLRGIDDPLSGSQQLLCQGDVRRGYSHLAGHAGKKVAFGLAERRLARP
jgi:hypothetical protein